MPERKSHPLLSLVVPFYNEEAVARKLYERVRAAMDNAQTDFEIVCVNDGSRDGTLEILRALHATDPRVRVVSFSRNFGHQVAVSAGLRYATGDIVAVLDADLQDPPEVVLEMAARWREGFDVVYGVRQTREAGRFISLCYRSFYRLLHKLSPLPLPLDAGDFCLMDRRVVDAMCRLEEERPYVRGLRAWVGFRQTGLAYDRPARAAGETKYNFLRLFRLAFDGLLSFSNLALRLSTITGFIVSGISILYALYIAGYYACYLIGLVDLSQAPKGYASLACFILLLMGLQFIFIGVLGEYVGRVFMQVKGRPLYIVAEEIGFRDA